MIGVDISNYSAVPAPAQLQCWWDAGVRFVMVGCQRIEPARSQFRVLNADGRFALEAYQYYYYDGLDRSRTERALSLMVEAQVQRLRLDVEWNVEDGPEPGPARVLPVLRSEVARVLDAAKEPAFYSSLRFWPSMAGNTTEFSQYHLCHAAYTKDGRPPDFATFKPYGGWTAPDTWQYAGSVQLCGINVDLNAREEAPDLTQEERKELEDDRIKLSIAAANDDERRAVLAGLVEWHHVDDSKTSVAPFDPATGNPLELPLKVKP